MDGARFEVVIIGAGQAGLAVSHELGRAGVPYVVLERGRVGQTWRGRWDSFRLVAPNWTTRLPGQTYDGPDPDGFDHREQIVGFLERYATAGDLPVWEGVEVTSLEPRPAGGFVLRTSAGRLEAERVVLATGAYQRPHRPAGAATLPGDLLQIDAEGYRNPAQLPPGPVLVIGSGQTGSQIAEELADAGRDVFLACGRAPWAPRRINGHDAVWWALETGFLDAPVGSLPDPSARLAGNVLATGHDGGRDIHLRTLRSRGVTLLGRFLGAEGRHARFAPDLGESAAWADERCAQFLEMCCRLAADRGLAQPDAPELEPFSAEAPEWLSLRGFGAAVIAGGFRPDYKTWVHIPDAFDALGFPVQEEGASTVMPGLYFVGVHFLRKRKSALLLGVGEDAAIVAGQIVSSLGRRAPLVSRSSTA